MGRTSLELVNFKSLSFSHTHNTHTHTYTQAFCGCVLNFSHGHDSESLMGEWDSWFFFWSLVWGIPRAQQWILKCDVGERVEGWGLSSHTARDQKPVWISNASLSHTHTYTHTHRHTQTDHVLLLLYIILSHSAFYTSFCHFQIQHGAVLYCSVFFVLFVF